MFHLYLQNMFDVGVESAAFWLRIVCSFNLYAKSFHHDTLLQLIKHFLLQENKYVKPNLICRKE